MEYKIAVIRGDGIGPEIVAEAVRCWIRLPKYMAITFIIQGC